MLNKEKFAKEILELAIHGDEIAVGLDGKPCKCENTMCPDCLLHDSDSWNRCSAILTQWAEEKYTEPDAVGWSIVPINTRVIVRNHDSDRWFRRYFAGTDEYKRPLVFLHGADSWSNAGAGKMCYKQIKLASKSMID